MKRILKDTNVTQYIENYMLKDNYLSTKSISKQSDPACNTAMDTVKTVTMTSGDKKEIDFSKILEQIEAYIKKIRDKITALNPDLTLDADIKEKLVYDEPTMKALIELGMSGAQNVMHGVMATLAILTNSYDKQEINPDTLKLAKFATHLIPEEHKLDTPE